MPWSTSSDGDGRSVLVLVYQHRFYIFLMYQRSKVEITLSVLPTKGNFHVVALDLPSNLKFLTSLPKYTNTL